MEEKYYEILRHYVNPNDCSIVVKQLLSLHDVVGKKEQLKAFASFVQKGMWEEGDKDLTEFVDEFLTFNYL